MARRSVMGLVLQGAGSLAAYEAGVVARLVDSGLEAAVASAIDMGSVNAAILAGNPHERVVHALEEFWSAVAGWRAPDATSLRDLLERLVDFHRLNDHRSNNGPMPVAATVCKLRTGGFVIFSNMFSAIRPEHICASATSWSKMVEIDGEYYASAAYVGGTALPAMGELLSAARDAAFSTHAPVFAVALESEGGPKSEREARERLLEILVDRSTDMRRQADAAVAMAEAARRTTIGPAKRHELNYRWLRNLHLLSVPHEAMSGVHNFDRRVISTRFRAGYDAADQFLKTFDPHPLPTLPPDVREIYATALSVGTNGAVFHIWSIPAAHAEGARLRDLDRTQIADTSQMIGAVAEILSGYGQPDHHDPAMWTELAAGIVNDANIPVAQSPLKAFTIAGLLLGGSVGSAFLSHPIVDGTVSPMVIVEMGGSLLMLGAGNIGYRFMAGFAKAAERKGEALGDSVLGLRPTRSAGQGRGAATARKRGRRRRPKNPK